MALPFSKYHGLGNDFIIINSEDVASSDTSVYQLAQTLCHRHMGIGGDGLIIVHPSSDYDFRMQIINSDGSEPEMCGNGIRCMAQYLADKRRIVSPSIDIETPAGLIRTELVESPDYGPLVKVDMGTPSLKGADIPVTDGTDEPIMDHKLTVGSTSYQIHCVSMGNPHCVIFVDRLEDVDLICEGIGVSDSGFFPEGVNVEFCEVVNNSELKVKVWERGAGATLACGTGACASLVAGAMTDRTFREGTVHLPGGLLSIAWGEDDHVLMTGPATFVFDGVFEGVL